MPSRNAFTQELPTWGSPGWTCGLEVGGRRQSVTNPQRSSSPTRPGSKRGHWGGGPDRLRPWMWLPNSTPGLQWPPSRPGAPGPGPSKLPASPCRVGPRCDPEAFRKRFRSQRRQDGGGHAGEAGVCSANADSDWGSQLPPSRSALASSLGAGEVGGRGCGGRDPGAASGWSLRAPGPAPPGRRRLTSDSRS